MGLEELSEELNNKEYDKNEYIWMSLFIICLYGDILIPFFILETLEILIIVLLIVIYLVLIIPSHIFLQLVFEALELILNLFLVELFY